MFNKIYKLSLLIGIISFFPVTTIAWNVTSITKNFTVSEAYTKLEQTIALADSLYDETKKGAEDFLVAINAAKIVLNDAESKDADYTNANTTLEKEILRYRVANGTGTLPVVKTLSVIEGSTMIFARGTFTNATLEKGFCCSTSPNPTIYDIRSTLCYSNNGDIYELNGLTPATFYYVRAYGITKNYRVNYGATVRIATLPKGTISGYYDNAGPDQTTNDRIQNAFDEAVAIWNATGSISGFSPSVHYSAGTPTADCSYGGWIRMGANSSYQRTGTIMHEMLHGAGVIPGGYGWNSEIYREGTTSGKWLGYRVDRIMQFLENDASAYLNGDYQHMWPYGINGAHEDTGSPMLYRANGLIIQALTEDGLISPNQSFAHPAYTFQQNDTVKYYLKNESETYGLNTTYLREVKNLKFAWEGRMSEDILACDSFAWYVTFNPSTGYYNLKNVATGHTVVYISSGLHGIRMAAKGNGTNDRFQFMPARASVSASYGKYITYTFTAHSYWIVSPAVKMSLSAAVNNNCTALAFNHTDAVKQQRWLIMTADEVKKFGKRIGDKELDINDIQTNSQSILQFQNSSGKLTISTVGGAQEVTVYDLNGRLLHALYLQNNTSTTLPLPHGIYLVNGEKVLVE